MADHQMTTGTLFYLPVGRSRLDLENAEPARALLIGGAGVVLALLAVIGLMLAQRQLLRWSFRQLDRLRQQLGEIITGQRWPLASNTESMANRAALALRVSNTVSTRIRSALWAASASRRRRTAAPSRVPCA